MRRGLLIALGLALGCTDAQFADPDLGPPSDDLGVEDGGIAPDLGGRDMLMPERDSAVDMFSEPDLFTCDPCEPTPGSLVITEIMPDTDVASDDFGEWFEIHNPSETITYDLLGCTLSETGNSHLVTAPLLVPPRESLSLARFATEAEGGFVPDYTYGPTLKFANEGDRLRVVCNATLIDEVDFTIWFLDKGRSLSLDPGSYDTVSNDIQANWCIGVDVYNTDGIESDYGSPSDTNPACP